MPCYVMLCYVRLCHVMSCYVRLCHVMLCYVVLLSIFLAYGKTVIDVPDRKPRNVANTRTRKNHCCFIRKKGDRNREPFFHLFTHTFYMKKRIQGTETKRREEQMEPVWFLVSYFVFQRSRKSQGPLSLRSADQSIPFSWWSG